MKINQTLKALYERKTFFFFWRNNLKGIFEPFVNFHNSIQNMGQSTQKFYAYKYSTQSILKNNFMWMRQRLNIFYRSGGTTYQILIKCINSKWINLTIQLLFIIIEIYDILNIVQQLLSINIHNPIVFEFLKNKTSNRSMYQNFIAVRECYIRNSYLNEIVFWVFMYGCFIIIQMELQFEFLCMCNNLTVFNVVNVGCWCQIIHQILLSKVFQWVEEKERCTLIGNLKCTLMGAK
eukprot:TRINITY_DN61629_c0_g1_i6.p2 TRINITY_DN61629_c0_g1~~TRINITY_DN61629_c0_g1_i6.p2  ORF type:complete len:235 (-),score=-7.92 TRINITY_DN61629_c0_g1_i6:38-742(-)